VSRLTDEHAALRFLARLLEFHTPSGQEGPLARFLLEELSALGYDQVRVDSVGNVLGRVGSGPPVTLFCGHMDTVPEPQPVQVTPDRLYGRGAVDAKSALAAMVLAGGDLAKTQDAFGTVLLAAVVDEEGDSQGILEFLKAPPRLDYAVFGEPGGMSRITVGYKGHLFLEVACRTAPAHASAPWMTPSAVEGAYAFYEAVREYCAAHPAPDYYRMLTVCLTRISGGTAHNVVPDRCQMTLDLRIPHTLAVAGVRGQLEQLAARFRQEHPGVALEILKLDATEPYETPRNSILIRAVSRAILEAGGESPRLLRKTGTGDMNVLGHTLGIPAVTYGPGDPRLSHAPEEFVTTADFLAVRRVFAHIPRQLYRLHPRPA
jgi:LysW-gamma-L-lysine carboxypeptidase